VEIVKVAEHLRVVTTTNPLKRNRSQSKVVAQVRKDSFRRMKRPCFLAQKTKLFKFTIQSLTILRLPTPSYLMPTSMWKRQRIRRPKLQDNHLLHLVLLISLLSAYLEKVHLVKSTS
jgi:hypothetical protein